MKDVFRPKWELEWVPAKLGLVHFGIAYMYVRPFEVPFTEERLTVPGEHQLQIGLLLGRIVIHYNVYLRR